jgi:hypothetical protein
VGFARRQAGEAGRDGVIGAGELADAEIPCPVTQPEGRLRVTGLRDVAEEQQIRRRQTDHE